MDPLDENEIRFRVLDLLEQRLGTRKCTRLGVVVRAAEILAKVNRTEARECVLNMIQRRELRHYCRLLNGAVRNFVTLSPPRAKWVTEFYVSERK